MAGWRPAEIKAMTRSERRYWLSLYQARHEKMVMEAVTESPD